jgi:hypothetical protein
MTAATLADPAPTLDGNEMNTYADDLAELVENSI